MPTKPSILEFFLTKVPKIAKAAKVVAQVIKDARRNTEHLPPQPQQKALPKKKPVDSTRQTVVKMAFLTRQDNTTVKEIDEKLKEFYTSDSLPFFEIYDREIFQGNAEESYHVCMYFDVLVEAGKKEALAEMRSRAIELVEKSSEVLGYWVRV